MGGRQILSPLSAWLVEATRQLEAAGIEWPQREARLLLAHALGISREELLMARDTEVPASANALLARRCRREPLALIVGRREFWSLMLEVSPATLVPRPDSETLIEAALAAFPRREEVAAVLDLGTGTGCLLLAALTEFGAAWGVGIDAVEAAVRLARRNAVAVGLAGRAAFIAGDWSAAVVGRFDLVICNPPYIESGAIGALMPEVAVYEPISALDGGADGLDAYRQLLPVLPGLLTPGGAAILEVGRGQDAAVAALAVEAGLSCGQRSADLGGITRALVLRRP